MPFGNIKLASTCDICGAPNAHLRTVEDPNGIINWLSGHTCQECFDTGKEQDYVQKMWDTKIAEGLEYNTLLSKMRDLFIRTKGDPPAVEVEKIIKRINELNKNQEARDQHTERYLQVISINKANFISEHGLGVKHKRCKICGQGNSYLCIFENHYEDCVEIFDELSLWACADCNSNSRLVTHIEKILREFFLYRKECDNAQNIEEFCKLMGAPKSSEEMKNYLSTIEYGKELEALKAMHESTAKLMRTARLSYKDVPVKISIKTFGEGDTYFSYSETIDEDHKCGAD